MGALLDKPAVIVTCAVLICGFSGVGLLASQGPSPRGGEKHDAIAISSGHTADGDLTLPQTSTPPAPRSATTTPSPAQSEPASALPSETPISRPDSSDTSCGTPSPAKTTIAKPISSEDAQYLDPAIAIGCDGIPLISFVESSGDERVLKIARCESASCAEAKVTEVGPVDSGLMTCVTSSKCSAISVTPEGRGLVAYLADGVRTALCTDVSCSDVRVTKHVGGIYGDHISMATREGRGPVIAYLRDHLDVAIAVCRDAVCSSSKLRDLDVLMGTPEVVIGHDGLPLIVGATYGNLYEGVHVVHCNDPGCASWTTTRYADNVHGDRTDVVMRRDGRPLILSAFTDFVQVGNVVKAGPPAIIDCLDPACASADRRVLPEIDVGWDSVAIGADGRPVITYTALDGEPTGALGVLSCIDLGCRNVTRDTVIIGDFDMQSVGIASGQDGSTWLTATEREVIPFTSEDLEMPDVRSIRIVRCGASGC